MEGVELVYVDDAKTPALKLGTTEEGHAVVVRLGKCELIELDENGSLELSSSPADDAVSKSSTRAKSK